MSVCVLACARTCVRVCVVDVCMQGERRRGEGGGERMC